LAAGRHSYFRDCELPSQALEMIRVFDPIRRLANRLHRWQQPDQDRDDD
jgi:hypothetical protein